MPSEEEEEQQYDINSNAIRLQNRILLNNQNKFNKNFNYTNQLNKTILTKDKLINHNENTNQKNDRIINILGSTIFLIFLIGIIGILVYYKVLTIKAAKYIVLVFVLVYIYKVFIEVKFKYRDFSKASEHTSKELDNSFRKYEKHKLESKMLSNINNYECPSNCSTVEDNSDDNNDNNISSEDLSVLIPYRKYMNTDSQRNVWKYGSAYDTLYTSEDEPDIYQNPKKLPIYRNNNNSSYTEPKQFVTSEGINSKRGIFYTCKWNGSPENRYAPINQDYEKTTIPCQYFPGFSTSKIEYCDVTDDRPENCQVMVR